MNRFHLIDIITKCSQHIFHSYSLQRCYLHQPCMKNMRISINPFFNANHDLRKIGYIPTPSPPQKKKNTHYSLTFFFYLHSVLNRFHLIDIITKCSQHIFHSYSLQRCYLHQPCMKNIFDHCIGSLAL
ncbi:MAG: hypothetical protein ALMCE001_00780 [Methanocorpusculum sp. MCE]|nr:MAG: hypothetical protein ALMCE001_00780 [Methanocorpusculum sp. MCE]